MKLLGILLSLTTLALMATSFFLERSYGAVLFAPENITPLLDCLYRGLAAAGLMWLLASDAMQTVEGEVFSRFREALQLGEMFFTGTHIAGLAGGLVFYLRKDDKGMEWCRFIPALVFIVMDVFYRNEILAVAALLYVGAIYAGDAKKYDEGPKPLDGM